MFIRLPFKKRYTLLRKVFKPEIYSEAFSAYLLKLPNNIQVNWFRDEGMIVGTVKAGAKEFMTQGEDTDDFIKMVNQSVIAAFNVPDDYVDAIAQARIYNPPPEDRRLLENKKVLKSSFGFIKVDRKFRVA